MMQPLIIDSFAGGGGASTGIEIALGRSPDVAINHNAAALALHAANHPETLHLDSNIWDVEPIAVTKGRKVGLLWASPDCKHFSKAKGGAPKDRNIRDLAWVVVKWAEDVKPDVICMENVEEFLTWGPVGEDGQPLEWLKGATFLEWKKRLKKAGYKVQHRELRACDYGAPTIRKRFFLIARRDGQPIVWPKPTHGDPKSPAVRSGKLLPWRTAAECIDWSLPCPSIFDTKDEIMAKHGLRAQRPLAANTLSRVARGTKRYVLDAVDPFLVSIAHGDSGGRREYPLDDPFGVVTAQSIGHALVVPSITRFNGGATGQDMRDPMATVTANSWIKKPGGASPLGMIAPALATFYGHNDGRGVRSADLAEPLRTVTVENRHALIAPSLMGLKGTERRGMPVNAPHPTVLAGGKHSALISAVLTYAQHGGAVRDITNPAHTITASKKDQNAIISPHLMTMRNSGKPFNGADEPTHTITAGGAGLSAVIASIVGCGGRASQSRPRGMDEPFATFTAKADACIASAFLAQHNGGPRMGANSGHDAREPMSTVAASGSHQTPVHAFIARHFGQSVGHGIDEPVGTTTAGGGGKSGLVAPWFAKYYGTGDGARADDPMHTVTVNDRFGHLEANLQPPPFQVEHEMKARKVADFLRAHDAWDDREFVTIEIGGETFVIVDIGMRMLTPRELFHAQGFPPDYVIEGIWTGTEQGWSWEPFPKDVQISCCGNSVCPPLAAAIVQANCGHLKVEPSEERIAA